ncbi:hypothetical protein PAT3040_03581 [Paenibacillus agaridevorans]|uniref:Neutral/alkaline non-lysosomal ceramidase N-terminal domain-containing protein n=1 Tax=Paenibacillus agaridevorans TaxID=171404 RepID=A0A2R5F054_9BACL|nr:hypothetical protein PAT3040_03581 [Paenibacillus agaridevorans]
MLEPLYAHAFAWQTEDVKGVIISCDLLGISKEITEQVRSLIQAECQIPFDHILVSATHSHSGPTTVDLIGWGEKDSDYLAGMPERIAQAAVAALAGMVDVTFEYGETHVEGIAYNRVSHSKESPGGLSDHTLKLLKVVHEGKMIGFLSHYSVHPVVMCADTSFICGDFIGIAINKLSSQYGVTGMFLQGSLGDQNSIYNFENQEQSVKNVYELSARFAGFVEEAISSALPLEIDAIVMKRVSISLPLNVLERSMILRNLEMVEHLYEDFDELPAKTQRRIRFERDVCKAVWDKYDEPEPAVLKTELQALKLGNILLIAHPTELFYAYHVEIERELAPYKTFIVGQANDSIGYIPTPDQYEVSQGAYSYPAWFTSFMYGQLPFVRNIGEVITKQMIELGQSLVKS